MTWVPIDEYVGLAPGEFGSYTGFNFIKSKGGSIWVRTKPRFRTPMKVRPIYPNRDLAKWR